MYGTHLKASAAMVRLRLYDVLSMLPPQSYEGTIIYTSIISLCSYTEPKKKLSQGLIVDMLVQFQSFWLKAYIFVK
jgi:hypothetical protein